MMLTGPQARITPAEEMYIIIMVRTIDISPTRIEGTGHARTTESLDEVVEPIMPVQEIYQRIAARLQTPVKNLGRNR